VSTVRRLVAASFLGAYRLLARGKGKSFSLLAAGSFASFGSRTVLEPPIRLSGERRIAVGTKVFIGANSWLQVLDGYGEGVALSIGDGTNIVGGCVFSAARSITIGHDVLMARNVYISDHSHAFEDPSSPVIKQGITAIAPVEIGDGAWLGQNVLIGPGVCVGRGAVIGANSVVLSDVPDYTVAAGAPARLIRRYADEDSRTDSA
jgi:acetyltransferase-like isoleucine patch superfamily enzyme